MAKEKRSFYGTGRRKGSVAKVTLTPGTGKITVNGKDVHEYMPYEVLVMDLKQPLVVTKIWFPESFELKLKFLFCSTKN